MVTTPDRRKMGGTQPREAVNDVIVAPMRRRHLRGVLAIEQLVYPKPWSPALFVAEIAQPDTRRYLVALSGSAGGRTLWSPAKAVVGYAGVMVAVGEAHITTVATHPHHHRRKIASHLLLSLLHEARSMGADAATLEVRVNNRGAQRLYAGFGFAPVGIRKGYYAETGEDALIMWAYDINTPTYDQVLRRQADRLDRPGGASGADDLHVPWVRDRVGLPERES